MLTSSKTRVIPVNATNNLNERPPSQTFTRLAPVERMEWENAETTKKLLSIPFFIITFSMTALLALSIFHARLTEQQHNLVTSITAFATIAMLLGLVHVFRAGTKSLLIYSVSCALILGFVAPLGW